MKITNFHAANYQMLSDINIDLSDHALALIGGLNEQGKSSLLEALRHALCGEATRVKLKKDLRMIVRDGAKSSTVAVRMLGGETAQVKLPSAAAERSFSLPEPAMSALPYCLDPAKIAALQDRPSELRQLIFAVTGLACNPMAVQARLAARKIGCDKITHILPFLRAGFPASATEATAKAREAKGAWERITGEKWGSEKAVGWTPVVPPEALDAGANARDARSEYDDVTESIKLAQQRQAEANAAARFLAQVAGERNRQEERAAMLPRLEKKLAADTQNLAAHQRQLASLRARGGVGPRVGLMHDLARAVTYFVRTYDPNGATQHAATLRAYEAEFGPVESDGDAEAAAAIPAAESAVALMESAVANTKRDLATATAAAEAIKNIAEQSAAPPAEPFDQAALDALIQRSASLLKEISNLDTLCAVADGADQKKQDADNTHAEIVAWLELAEALSPEGIPGEMVKDALKPINARMRETANHTGWDQVTIDGEMVVRLAGRPYSLGSESARWRADAALADAFSFVSGLKFFALDRLDVLVSAQRLACLKWLRAIATAGDVDTAFVAGTFTQRPSVPREFVTVWLENGAPVELDEQQAA
ncbi:MAG: AAA family ATPase [Rhodocyclaceae bacterium]|nr:AAA family ATPase [Rhodocyclaceae bacterium]